MNDTVKLIIEIPKEAKQAFDDTNSYDLSGIIGKAIQNGIPLDDVNVPSGSKGEWIPIKVRPLTEEEKEYYTEHGYSVDFMMMYDCPMPDDGQEVLITTSTGYVTTDTYYIDEGGYFENYCDEGDVKAWMPKPEPYKKGGAE